MIRQKKIRNIKYKDIYSLDSIIARLKFNTEKTDNGHWKMVKDPDSTFNREAYMKWHIDKQKTIEEGLKLFAEYFQDLWI